MDVPGSVIVPHQEQHGGIPKTLRVPNKPPRSEGRKQEARSVMKLDPEGNIFEVTRASSSFELRVMT